MSVSVGMNSSLGFRFSLFELPACFDMAHCEGVNSFNELVAIAFVSFKM